MRQFVQNVLSVQWLSQNSILHCPEMPRLFPVLLDCHFTQISHKFTATKVTAGAHRMKNNLHCCLMSDWWLCPAPAELYPPNTPTTPLGAPGGEGTGHSQPPLAAIATVLRPPGLLDIPFRNFPFGTSPGLAIHCPSEGSILQSCH